MRLPLLDLLRFLAAFAVMAMHILLRGFPNDTFYHHSFGPVGDLLKWNYLAVNLFFIISGYVIFLSCQHGDFKKFVQSRFLRLFPAYWLCCLFSFGIAYWFLQDVSHVTVPRFVLNMTMLNGFFGVGYIDGVFWTLTLELKFYILISLILLFNQLDRIDTYLWGWLLISIFNFYANLSWLKYVFITDYASFFIAGACFYLIQRNGSSILRISMLTITFVLGFAYENTHLILKTEHYGLTYKASSLFVIIAALYTVFYLSTHIKAEFKRLAPLLSGLGLASYPLYLIHLNLSLAMLNVFAPNGHYRFAIASTLIVMCPLLAYLIAIYFEKPFASYLKFLINKKG